MERDTTTITVPRSLRDRLAEKAKWQQPLSEIIEELLDIADNCTCEANRERLGKAADSDRVLAVAR